MFTRLILRNIWNAKSYALFAFCLLNWALATIGGWKVELGRISYFQRGGIDWQCARGVYSYNGVVIFSRSMRPPDRIHCAQGLRPRYPAPPPPPVINETGAEFDI